MKQKSVWRTVYGKLFLGSFIIYFFHAFGFSLFSVQELSMFGFIGAFEEARLMAGTPSPAFFEGIMQGEPLDMGLEARKFADAYAEHTIVLFFFWVVDIVFGSIIVFRSAYFRVCDIGYPKIPLKSLMVILFWFCFLSLLLMVPYGFLIISGGDGRGIMNYIWGKMLIQYMFHVMLVLLIARILFNPIDVLNNIRES